MLYTFFDVETPNGHNDRPCSIGAIVSDEHGHVERRVSMLINPEERFDDINMRIHGIRPIDVVEAPTLPQAWDECLRDVFSSGTVIAHNARFDLCVMAKALRSYGIAEPRVNYACTMDMSRDLLVNVESLKLPSVCRALGIDMGRHHDACADTEACYEIFWKLTSLTDDVSRFFSPYFLDDVVPMGGHHAQRHYSEKTMTARKARALAERAIEDGAISIEEALEVLDVIRSSAELSDDAAFSRVAALLQSSVVDGEITQEESRMLTAALSEIVDPASSDCSGVSIEGSTFCLSGNYTHGSKSEVEEFIVSHGGVVARSVTKKCDFVVIGDQGSEAYGMGGYGTKVEKAMAMRAKGSQIRVIHESDLYAGA